MFVRILAFCAWLLLICGSPSSSSADDSCSEAALPPSFDATSFDECSPIDLDGKAPCEVACDRVSPAPDFRSGNDGREPNFHMLGHTIYFAVTRKTAKQIGRIVTYDGPLDAANPRHAADRSTRVFVDQTTSPPTLELRAGSCLYACEGAKNESECRAACRPSARYRYNGKRLKSVR